MTHVMVAKSVHG